MVSVAIAKLRSFSILKSTTGSFSRHSQIIPAIIPININAKNPIMKFDANQSSRCPLSRMICMLPSPRLIKPMPM